MTLPFPGMDPFLEDPNDWADVHHSLLSTLRDHLAAQLAPAFFTRIDGRIYVTDPAPDAITRPLNRLTEAEIQKPHLVVSPAQELEIPVEHTTEDHTLAVYDTRSHQVLLGIEILTPATKVHGSPAWQAMQENRRQLLRGGCHWIEIDLLRQGDRHPLVAGRSDYVIILQRALQSRIAVWFIDLRDRLPTIAVPLRSPFLDIPLDIQQVFQDTYERAHYHTSVDYTRQVPAPALLPADLAWVERHLDAWKHGESLHE